jgi:opacity protein-like surface antigen
MNKKVMMFVSALGVVSSAQAAFAQSVDQNERGVYVALQGGVAKVNDVDVDYFDQAGTFGGTGGQDIAEFKADLKNAFNVKGAVGYDFGLIRADVEVAYSRNKVKGLTVEGINGTPVTLTAADRTDVCDYLEVDTCGGSGNTFQVDGGKLRQLSALGNIWVDVPTGSVVTPYIGGGLGVAGFELNGEGKARFAWQLGAGVAFNVSPSAAITLDYRHRQAKGATITDDDFEDAGVRVGKIHTNAFTAGARFRF